ncbi:MAG TPA: hypothetical protein VH763_08195 [Gemmatimonadales bacterium]|jgi:hypothetical protein
MARKSNDLEKAAKKWKDWLKNEFDWQKKIRTRVNRLWRDAGNPGGPADLPPPPKPPFK